MTHNDDLTFDAEGALRHADDLRRRVKLLEDEVRDTEIDVTSRDKSIVVTVTTTGRIRDLQLDASKYDGRTASDMARAILETLQKAQQIGEEAGVNMARRYLPNVPNFREMMLSKTEDTPDAGKS